MAHETAAHDTAAAEAARVELVRRIHASPALLVLAVTGGGVAAIGDLLSVPGASRTVLEVTVPYAEAALADLVGGSPAQATSVSTAAAMARACRDRAVHLASAGQPGPLLGLAATAALATDRPKRGDHRAHVALDDGHRVRAWSLTLDKGARDRLAEDRLVADLLVAVLGAACGVAGDDPARVEPLCNSLSPHDVLVAGR